LGADRRTRNWLAHSTAIDPWSHPYLEACRQLNTALRSSQSPGVKIAAPLSIWIGKPARAKAAYREKSQYAFGVEPANLDFGAPDAAAQINDWVSKSTEGKIAEIVERTDPDTQIVIASALYFNGRWMTPFDPAQTEMRPFLRRSGGPKDIATMQGQIPGGYWHNQKLRAASLPYGAHGSQGIEFVVVQARSRRKSIARGGAELSELLPALRKGFAPALLQIQIPKFGAASRQDLRKPLRALGLGRLYDPRTRFDGIAGESIGVPEVLHAARIDVDESGTEAAATTVITGTRSAEIPIKFTVDRPFMFIIWHSEQKLILFHGMIEDPTL
jgi:serpin B